MIITHELTSINSDKIYAIIGKEEFEIITPRMDVETKSKIVVISITDPDVDAVEPELFYDYADHLRIQFWDITKDFYPYDAITDEQGKQIKDFILKNKDAAFLIHCMAGISRSAGVGCAVECLLNYDGDVYAYATGNSDVKGFWRYAPNLKVFDTIVGNDTKKI